ncbi:hypothetical protein [Rheinheimera sp.]|uniref:hypothetical protein n=1 Tax=Rheinheimera sp. TaxID=1869214 RepID=UPI003D288E09
MKNLQRCHPFFRSIGVPDLALLCHKLLCGGGFGRNKNKYLIKLVGYFTPFLYALTSKPDQPVLCLRWFKRHIAGGIYRAIIGLVLDLQLAKMSGQDNLTGTNQARIDAGSG